MNWTFGFRSILSFDHFIYAYMLIFSSQGENAGPSLWAFSRKTSRKTELWENLAATTNTFVTWIPLKTSGTDSRVLDPQVFVANHSSQKRPNFFPLTNPFRELNAAGLSRRLNVTWVFVGLVSPRVAIPNRQEFEWFPVSDLLGGGFPKFFQDLAWKTTNHALKKKAPTGTCTYKWKQNSRQIFRHGAYGIDTVDICLIKEMCQTMAFDYDYLSDVDLILSASDTYELLCPYLGNVMQETMRLTIPTESKPLDPIAGFVKY